MGNSGSHTQVAQPLPLDQDQKWAHSFPRTPSKKYQHKVLPDRDAPLRLRPTNNGEILHSGGTLSGRHQQQGYGVYRSNSISSNRPNEKQQFERSRTPTSRSYVSNHKDLLHKSGQRYSNNDQRYKGPYTNRREQMKRFGSEPDLRDTSSRTLDVQDRSKTRKKYKAPPPPPMVEKSSDSWEGDSEPTRRARLFKTRAETKKKSSPVNNRRSLEEPESATRQKVDQTEPQPVRLSLPEMKRSSSIPEFQAELKEATKRLRNAKIQEETKKETTQTEDIMKSKLKTLDHNIKRKEVLRNKLKEIEDSGEKFDNRIVREDVITTNVKKQPQDVPKMFYFGMDHDKNSSMPRAYSSNNLVDHFVSTLHPHTNIPLNSSGSDISSELDLGESNVSSNGIALQLRPILPKKQFEIPRFSPATAWKLLSAVESNHAPSTAPSDDVPMFIEERIEKLSRLPPPPTVQDGPRSSHDKSGDSGISGDAGPAAFDENEPVMTNQTLPNNFRTTGVSWTPQQDLGDDSSIDENTQPVFNSATPMFSPRPHVFSLSLPRDNHLSSYLDEKSTMQVYTGLQKLKRSVSGVLNNLGPVQPPPKKDVFHSQTNQEQSDNWFLSKSAPNSLNNGFNSLELKSRKIEEDLLIHQNNSQNTGRVMYLPKLEEHSRSSSVGNRSSSHGRERERDRSKSAERSTAIQKMHLLSKSCENISSEVKSSSEPEDLQDPPKYEDKWKIKKPKRFTFQSTVRQIERKRLAERLSKEAEKKEKQRLRELEAMQKVEEEFQRKRAREKASIRQQLRLYSMDDNVWSSLPPNINNNDVNHHHPMMTVRQEPEGAVSSSASSPVFQKEEKPARKSLAELHLHQRSSSSDSSDENKVTKATTTKVLSEYRQPQREYKDFRGRYHQELVEPKQTIHPEVTYHMPMAHAYQSNSNHLGKSANYRKDFAHGKKTSKSGGSTYSDDSQSNTNHTPMMYHSKRAPITRF